MKQPLFGKTLRELSEITVSMSMPSFSAKQIAAWLYKKNISSIDGMTDLSASSRYKLNEKYCIGITEPVAEQVSKDGTKKYLFPVLSGENVETAYIPERERATLCVSSQVGCRMGCVFCMTGKQKWKANLTATDILNQFRSVPEHANLTNIVFMGMGEPFDNLDEVMKALEILTADYGYAWAPKRITVSTIGVLPAIKYFMENSRCHLAVSLHNPESAGRKQLMPVENKYSIKKVVELLKTYDLNRQRRISFEYIMLGGVNDFPQHAKELIRLLNGLRCRVNLIRFHPIPGVTFTSSSEQAIRQFAETLNQKGIVATVRQSRGLDIDAACGMLSTASQE